MLQLTSSSGTRDRQQLHSWRLLPGSVPRSGSTLIACERTGRRCAGIEIDPTYADVVLGRWERFSGQIASRIDD